MLHINEQKVGILANGIVYEQAMVCRDCVYFLISINGHQAAVEENEYDVVVVAISGVADRAFWRKKVSGHMIIFDCYKIQLFKSQACSGIKEYSNHIFRLFSRVRKNMLQWL